MRFSALSIYCRKYIKACISLQLERSNLKRQIIIYHNVREMHRSSTSAAEYKGNMFGPKLRDELWLTWFKGHS